MLPEAAARQTSSATGAPLWELADGRSLDCSSGIVFGVLNATPDSFYDGGRHQDHGEALKRLLAWAEAGVHVADIGGESTRPGAAPVPATEELQRVLPLVREAAKLSIAVSVDTYKAEVAAACLEAGAQIVNDVSACRFDPGLVDVLAQKRPGYVLMHSAGRPETMQQDPRYDNVVDEVLGFLEERLAWLVSQGLPENRVLLDPGICFGKTLEHNLELLRNVERLQTLGRPVLLGLSNKSLWGALLGLAVDQREHATQVATALCAARGAQAHRVHEPVLALQTLRIVRALGVPGAANPV